MQQESWKTETNKHKHQPKIFPWLQAWTFQRIRARNYLVCVLEEKNWSSITCETIKYKTQKLAKSHNITQHYFVQRTGFSLHRRTLPCQEFPTGFEEKLIAFQWREWTSEKSSYLLNQRGNADETPLYFDILSKYAVDEIGAKSMVIKTLSCEEMHVKVMLVVLADDGKLPPSMFWKQCLRSNYLAESLLDANRKVGWPMKLWRIHC